MNATKKEEVGKINLIKLDISNEKKRKENTSSVNDCYLCIHSNRDCINLFAFYQCIAEKKRKNVPLSLI